eukprot:GHVU01102984.1.p1 GENE.GHVU01102984.1~~GHVU01102984.1.p1  ORF type:complete len:293 (+),score=19.44 GHVU01102984.1:1492-2370(+)
MVTVHERLPRKSGNVTYMHLHEYAAGISGDTNLKIINTNMPTYSRHKKVVQTQMVISNRIHNFRRLGDCTERISNDALDLFVQAVRAASGGHTASNKPTLNILSSCESSFQYDKTIDGFKSDFAAATAEATAAAATASTTDCKGQRVAARMAQKLHRKLLAADVTVFPVNVYTHRHFVILVVHPTSKAVYVLDSHAGLGSRCGKVLANILSAVDGSSHYRSVDVQVPQQNDGVSCGVYAAWFVQLVDAHYSANGFSSDSDDNSTAFSNASFFAVKSWTVKAQRVSPYSECVR